MIVLALALAVQTALAPVRVGGPVAPPTKIKDVKPVYPASAQGSGVQGVVILETIIGPDGKVSDAKVLRSIPLLDQAAIDAVRQWEFTPTLLNGAPVPVIMTVTVNFALQGAPPYTPPSNPSMIRLTSSSMPGSPMYVWEISPERAAALPRWNPQGAPSVSMEEASRIAEDWVRAHNQDAQRFELQSINYSRVRRANPDIDFWYYQIGLYTYRNPPKPGDQLTRAVVLPDGTIVEPRIDPNPPGVYSPDPAHGVTYPRAITTVNPQYTDEARQKRISGEVFVTCVVRPDGTVSDARVTKSLDPGLDMAAIKAANQYRFVPGTRDGVPVPVFVTIEMTFNLR
jgi:TonB family protein